MKQYRPNVSAVILSPKYPFACEILIAQRIDIAGAWQFPQGGIDKGDFKGAKRGNRDKRC